MKRVLALLLAIVLVFGMAACGSESDEPTNATNANGDEGEDSGKYKNENERYYVSGIYNPLTGEATEEDFSKIRPIAISLNNYKAAMPMHGITAADIIIEMNVEKNVTRMVGIFQNITSETKKIGAIRSVRVYLLDWALAFDSIYMSASGPQNALKKASQMGIAYVNCNDDAARRANPVPHIAYRDPERLKKYALEHTMFAKGEGFEKYKSELKVQLEHKEGYECSLKFTTRAETADGKKAEAFTVKMNSVKPTSFEYDSASKLYKVSQHGGPYIDGNNKEQVAIKNVLVLYTKYWPESAATTRLSADMSGGEGVYFCEGKMIDIKWERSDDEGLKLIKGDGEILRLAVGKTFICCADAEKGGLEVK